MEVIFIIAGIIFLIAHILICSVFSQIAELKGWEKTKYFWLCLFGGIMGALLVIALPNEEGLTKKKEQPLNQTTDVDDSTSLDLNTDNGTNHKQSPELGKKEDASPVRPIKTEERGAIKCPLCGTIQYSGHTSCEHCGVQFIKNKL